MKLKQNDAKGYLRAGKVLQLMAMSEKMEDDRQKMLEKAAQIYELGIQAVGDSEGTGKKVSFLGNQCQKSSTDAKISCWKIC